MPPDPTPLRPLLLLALTGCAPMEYDFDRTPIEAIEVTPSIVTLERGVTPCVTKEIYLEGEDTLTGMLWEPESGRPEDIRLPPSLFVDLEDSVTIAFEWCPWDATPTSGAIHLTFEQSESALVWAREN